jgi:RNA polymerase sigma factor (TIGR02999 family)
MSDVTLLLNAIDQGNKMAAEELLPLVYQELRALAAHKLACEAPAQTLQATALVHEAYLRLIGGQGARWQNSQHFFCAAAEAMRRILVENARRKGRLKRGGGWQRLDVEQLDLASDTTEETHLFVHEALDKLALQDATCAELVKLRFFAGLSHEQSAQVLGLSERTARRNWAYARAWLAREIKRLNQTEQ